MQDSTLTYLLHQPEMNISRCQATAVQACALCSKEGQWTRRCGNCLHEYYCSGGCQRRHWRKDHRNFCQFIKLQVSSESGIDDVSDDDEEGDAPPSLPPDTPAPRLSTTHLPNIVSPVRTTNWTPSGHAVAAASRSRGGEYAPSHVQPSGSFKKTPHRANAAPISRSSSKAHDRRRTHNAHTSTYAQASPDPPKKDELNLPLLMRSHGLPSVVWEKPPKPLRAARQMPPLFALQHASTSRRIHNSMVSQGFRDSVGRSGVVRESPFPDYY